MTLLSRNDPVSLPSGEGGGVTPYRAISDCANVLIFAFTVFVASAVWFSISWNAHVPHTVFNSTHASIFFMQGSNSTILWSLLCYCRHGYHRNVLRRAASSREARPGAKKRSLPERPTKKPFHVEGPSPRRVWIFPAGATRLTADANICAKERSVSSCAGGSTAANKRREKPTSSVPHKFSNAVVPGIDEDGWSDDEMLILAMISDERSHSAVCSV